MRKITGKECRFATFVPPEKYGQKDLHVVKEIIHYDDGTSEPNVHLIYDFQYPFWVVKKAARNYEQPKEWIDVNRCQKYTSSYSRLIENASRALGTPWFKGPLRKLHENPYLFGTDIKSTAVVKKAYQDRYKDISPTPFSVAFTDIETDVVHGTGEIIMFSFYYQSKIVTGIRRFLIEQTPSYQAMTDTAMKKYLGEYVEKMGIVSELYVFDSEFDLLKGIIDKIHAAQPDLLAIWNMDFEMTKFIAACERAGVDPKDVFSDPKVPMQYRYFKYKQGSSQKVMASGKISPIPPHARWHTVYTPASFYIIDAMCAFKHIRMGQPERASYSLDSILSEELNLTKLRFDAADQYVKVKWHIFMQQNYIIEYLIYNRFDCISMALLEERNKDLSVFMILYSGTSDFSDFKSQPRRSCDQLHWEIMEKGKVIGTTSAKLYSKYDEMTVPKEGWISNLDAELVYPSGLSVIAESEDIPTTIFTNTGDSDVSAAYPHGEWCYQISKETTRKEVVEIEGIDPSVSHIQNMLLTTGHVDAVEWCTNMLQFPNLFDLSEAYDEKQRT